MSGFANPLRNSLLATLPAESKARILPRLRAISLPLGAVIHEIGQAQDIIYFPVTTSVSLLNLSASGASMEVALIGNEGVVGLAAIMGGRGMTKRTVTDRCGFAFALPTSVLMNEFDTQFEARTQLLRFSQALLTQVAQLVVCNRHHTIDQQLCRRLLLALDRQPGNRIRMTQALIADLLGVRRVGVTEAACRLRQLGVIRYWRGEIMVLDRPQLERLSCECYSAVRREYDRLQSCPVVPPLVAATC